jgi:hypothetical protein
MISVMVNDAPANSHVLSFFLDSSNGDQTYGNYKDDPATGWLLRIFHGGSRNKFSCKDMKIIYYIYPKGI